MYACFGTMNSHAQTVLLAIVSAHLMADFWLQGDDDVAAKRQFRIRAYLTHALTHAAGVYVFAGLWSIWQMPAVVFVAHPVIDVLKEVFLRWFVPRDAKGEPVTRWKLCAIVFDQLLHLAVLVAIVELLSHYGKIPVEPYWSDLLGSPAWRKLVVLLSGAVLTISVGGALVGILVQPLLREIENADPPEPRGLEKGGRIIGQLERALIFLFVLSAQPAGVGFLITAKSIFRFGELKDAKSRMEAEYIIIGTMLSFTWALGAAWLTQWALTAI